MNEKIILNFDSTNLKKPYHLKNNGFFLYAPRNIKVEPTESQRFDSGILTFVPENAGGFVTSKFREDEINEIWNRNRRLWVEILNKSSNYPLK